MSAILAIGAISLPLLASTTSAVAANPADDSADRKATGRAEGLRHRRRPTTSATRWPSRARPPSWARRATPRIAGRAYVFTKTATGWKQVAELKGSDTVASDYFGYSVAISGTTAVVGAPATPTVPAGRTCSPRRQPAGSRSPS